MSNRAEVYNHCVDACIALEKQGKMIVIAPDSIGNMKTLSKDVEAIKELHKKGYEAGKLIPKEWFE